MVRLCVVLSRGRAQRASGRRGGGLGGGRGGAIGALAPKGPRAALGSHGRGHLCHCGSFCRVGFGASTNTGTGTGTGTCASADTCAYRSCGSGYGVSVHDGHQVLQPPPSFPVCLLVHQLLQPFLFRVRRFKALHHDAPLRTVRVELAPHGLHHGVQVRGHGAHLLEELGLELHDAHQQRVHTVGAGLPVRSHGRNRLLAGLVVFLLRLLQFLAVPHQTIHVLRLHRLLLVHARNPLVLQTLHLALVVVVLQARVLVGLFQLLYVVKLLPPRI
mmetsp:Transcript_2687/g.8035  ORF Transcript_2687/g.8035 Transcript_2687/m.8035 type:complete len:273 (-) Transcript_2687:387-1205(-)